METTITVMHLLIASSGMIITVRVIVLTAWINMKVTVAELYVGLAEVEKDQDHSERRMETNFAKIWSRLNNIYEAVNDVRVDMKGKQDMTKS